MWKILMTIEVYLFGSVNGGSLDYDVYSGPYFSTYRQCCVSSVMFVTDWVKAKVAQQGWLLLVTEATCYGNLRWLVITT